MALFGVWRCTQQECTCVASPMRSHSAACRQEMSRSALKQEDLFWAKPLPKHGLDFKLTSPAQDKRSVSVTPAATTCHRDLTLRRGRKQL